MRFFRKSLSRPFGSRLSETTSSYWTRHNVTRHAAFATRAESLAHLDWRNAQYLFYADLLPTSGVDGLRVLDYGCGPGNDLVGFVEHSRPARLVGMDVSRTSLKEARARLHLHGGEYVELMQINESAAVPLEDASIDYLHCSGVLHHTANEDAVLAEFHRLLAPGGRVGVMVYHRDSIWEHLYVAYQRQIVRAIDSDLPIADAFRRSTDGPDCPISRRYTAEEFIRICERAGFRCTLSGVAISLHEMTLLPSRLTAIADARLAAVHREFLLRLSFDEHGRPLHNGRVAGIDAVFVLTKPPAPDQDSLISERHCT